TILEHSVEITEAAGRPLRDLPYGAGEFALVLVRGEAVQLATGDLKLAEGDRLYTALQSEESSPLASFFLSGPEKD
ncbi:MAG: hypothetical protein ABGY42_09595, partial [bacterium]